MRITLILLLMLCLLWAWCLPGNEVETVSMYMYNGVKLPALPEFEYEYAYIAENVAIKGWYALFVSDKAFVYDKLTNTMIRQDGSTVMRCVCTGEAWGEFVAHDADSLLAPIWANYDVLDTNGDVRLYATEPAKIWENARSFLIGLAMAFAGKPLPISQGGKEPVAYPVLAEEFSWYRGETHAVDITEINLVNSYTPTGSEAESWAADVDRAGTIMCYVNGTVLTIAGNGSGKMYANPNSEKAFGGRGGYYEFINVTSIEGLRILDTSKATTMKYMFNDCAKLESLDLSGFDTSNVTDMNCMFHACRKLITLDLSGFDTSNVTDMMQMFNNCDSLSQLDVSSFDTSNVKNMNGMFSFSGAIQQLDLRSFNTVNATNMNRMFKNCTSLNTVYVGDGWTTGNASSSEMFMDCGVSEVTHV